MVAMSDQKRSEAQQHQPIFWRKAADAAERQRLYFRQIVGDTNFIARICETDTVAVGFIIARVIDAPPVYDPGGKTCLIDDFCVVSPELWPSVGDGLLAKVRAAAIDRGAVQLVIVCAGYDTPKRDAIAAAACTLASEWHVGPA